ncbi:MAG: hypothetical protein LBJ08_07050 [Bifidobacteriaceae bacterium]|nr:hypothetical protein [Bifidobacteriaceae bacterium]
MVVMPPAAVDTVRVGAWSRVKAALTVAGRSTGRRRPAAAGAGLIGRGLSAEVRERDSLGRVEDRTAGRGVLGADRGWRVRRFMHTDERLGFVIASERAELGMSVKD